jgi:glycosyltransferase involved in cell wall biosynthesis
MRIVFVGPFRSTAFNQRYGHPSDPSLGGQRKMNFVLRALLVRGHDVVVVSSALAYQAKSGFQLVPDSYETFPEGVVRIFHPPTVKTRPWGGLLMCLLCPIIALRELWRTRPSLIISYNGLAAECLSGLLSTLSRGTPYIIEVEDLPGVRFKWFHPKSLLDRLLWPIGYRLAAGFTAVNSEILALAEALEKPAILLPGVIEDHLMQQVRNRATPFSGSERRLLYSGGLTKDRGAGVLLEALPQLPKGWKLVVTGTGHLASAFENESMKSPEKCEYLGHLPVDQFYATMCKCDVVVNTPERLSRNSGVFPFKMFEYIASGAHVISVKLPKINGLDLSWCEIWDGTSEHMILLLNDAGEEFARAQNERCIARDFVVSRFRLEAVAGQMDRLLRAIVRPKQ